MSQPITFMSFSEVQEQGFRNEAEKEFLTALFAHAPNWFQLGLTDDDCYINYWYPILMVAFDVCDWKRSQVLRSVKIDFTGTSVLMGETGSNLFDNQFNERDHKITIFKEVGGNASVLADLAAEWLYKELSREIIRMEWVTDSYRHTQYEMADTRQPLSWSDSQNIKRWWLGKPTMITIVHPLNKYASNSG